MSERGPLDAVVGTTRRNAVVAWLLVAFVGVVIASSIATGDLLWAGFAAVVCVLALIPALAHRRPAVMLPWEVLALAALPLIGRVLATVPLTGRFATYLAVAAVALVVAVELHMFTSVEMTPGFAVLFVVIATMAAAGLWAVVRWGLDVTLGTGFLVPPGATEAELEVIERQLMWEFVYSTAAGVVAGVIFEGYFRRRLRFRERVPDEVEVAGR